MSTNSMKIALAVTSLLLVAIAVVAVMNQQDKSELRTENASLKQQLADLNTKLESDGEDRIKAALRIQRDEMEAKNKEMELRLLAGLNQRISTELAGARTELERQQAESRKLDARFQEIKENSPVKLTKREREMRDAASIAKVIESHAEQGFVIINAGRVSNISKGAEFAVRRGTDLVGLLLVADDATMGENECAAQVVRGSMTPGDPIEAGDEVILRLDWMDAMVQR